MIVFFRFMWQRYTPLVPIGGKSGMCLENLSFLFVRSHSFEQFRLFPDLFHHIYMCADFFAEET